MSNPVVDGDYGESHVHFWATGGDYYGEVETGYNVSHSVAHFGWTVDVTDRFGVGSLKNSENFTPAKYSMTFFTHSGGNGYASAQLEAGSYVVLIDGEMCHSGAPWDDTFYYKD
ncbi:hypothetical protein [Kitasatospora sp. NPDC096140]|uniref:hypothetical protein n=1 Tax=unclassified Kitasatospora TaxID=2633591 RepID=UPI00332047A2